MKQTAVEWLEDNLIFVAWAEEHFIHNKKCLEQAKAMEKEQIIVSYETGARYALISQSDLALVKGKFPNSEQYYNETFKSE